MTAQKTRILPYKGTSHARLSELIEKSQPLALPLFSQFGFKYLEAVPGGQEGATRVTAIHSIGNVYQSDEIELNYTRLSLDVLKDLPHGEILGFEDVAYPTSTHRILDKINHALGLDLVESEVEDTPLAAAPEKMPVTITSKSLLWLPGTYLFNMRYTPADSRITSGGEFRITNTGRIRIISIKQKRN